MSVCSAKQKDATTKRVKLQQELIAKIKKGDCTLRQLKWYLDLTSDQRDVVMMTNFTAFQCPSKKQKSKHSPKKNWLSLFTTETGITVFDYGDHFRFTLPPTDGTTGPLWIPRLEDNESCVLDSAKSVLLSSNFGPTHPGVTTEIAVLKGSIFYNNQSIKNIREEAGKRKLLIPNAEIACLIRENFTNNDIKAMGLTWIFVMHKFIINNSDGDPIFLNAYRSLVGRLLGACNGKLDRRWLHISGFAFAVSSTNLP